MADNVVLNAGSGGVTAATDDCGAGGHTQIVKLAISTDGSATLIPAEATNGLDVDVTRVIPGTSATHLGKAEDAAHSSGDTGVAILGVRRDSAASGADTDGDYSTLNLDANGRLYVNPSGVTLTVASHAVTNAGTFATQVDNTVTVASHNVTNAGTFAVQATVAAGATNIAKAEDVGSADADVGVPAMAVRKATPANTSGTDGDYEFLQMSAGRLWVDPSGVTLTVASHAVTNAGTFAVQESGTQVLTDDAAFTPATTKVVMAGFEADESSTDSVDEGDGGAARMTLDRKQIVTPYAHAAAGGHSPFYNLDCDETEDAVKASAGKLFWIHAMNLANAKRYLKFYNATTANVTVGSTAPVLSFPIPTMADTNGAGFCIHFGDAGLLFDTAITIAATTGFADNDTGAPGANEVIVNGGFL